MQAAAPAQDDAPPFSIELAPLPVGSDITVSRVPEGIGITFRVKAAGRLMRLAWGWAAVFAVPGAVIGAAVAWPLWDSGWAILGLDALLPFLLVAGTFFLCGAITKERQATVTLTPDALVIVDQHQSTRLCLTGYRSDVLDLWPRFREKRELLFGDGRSQPNFYGLRFGPKCELNILLPDQRELRVLAGWDRDDLDWLASTIRRAWNLQRHASPIVDTPTATIDAEAVHGRREIYTLLGPRTLGLLACLGVGVAVIPLFDHFDGMRSLDWSPVPATVMTSDYHRGDSVRAAVVYRYEAAGRFFLGDTVSFSHQAGEDYVEALVAPLRPGDRVTVYVSPADPAKSVLIPGVDWSRPLMIGMGGSLLVITWLASLWRRRLGSRPLAA